MNRMLIVGYHTHHILGVEEVEFLQYKAGKAHSRFSDNLCNELEKAYPEQVAARYENVDVFPLNP